MKKPSAARIISRIACSLLSLALALPLLTSVASAEQNFESMEWLNTYASTERVNAAATDAPQTVTVAQPQTNVIGDIAMVREIHTKIELASVVAATNKPATVIVTIDKDLNVKAANGTSICTVDELISTTALTVLTAFRISDTATVDALAAYLGKIHLYDVLLLSDDPSVVRYAREKMPTTSGVIDFTKTFADKTELSEEDRLTIRRTVKANNASIAILPVSLCSSDTVQYLFNRQVNVWAKASDAPSEAEQYRAILSGAIGVISDDTESLLTVACGLPRSTMTRVPLNIGHRGIPSLAPENTIEGALLAHEKGANVIELDIYLTKDNEVVIMHDATTGRTCNRDLHVEGSTLAELKTLYVNKNHENHEGYSTCRIPTLREFLDAFQGKDCQLFIEIKTTKTAVIPLMRDLIEERGMYGQCSVITFHANQLKALRLYYPEMSGGFLCGSSMGNDTENSETLLRQDMNQIAPNNATLNPSYPAANYLSGNDTRAAFFRGISIYPWTFRGDINVYKTPFIEGHAGLTGDNADKLAGIVKSITTSMGNQTHVAVGSTLPLSLTTTTFAGKTIEKSSGITCTVLSGNDCATVGVNGLTFTKDGVVSFVLSHSTRISNSKFILYTDPITVTVGDPAPSPFVDRNDRAGGSQILGAGLDRLLPVTGGTEGASLLPPDPSAWDPVATLDATIESLVAEGLLSFNTEVNAFGYAIDGGTPVFHSDFTVTPETADLDAAVAVGASDCARFSIRIDLRDLSGEHTVDLLVKQGNGAVVSFKSFRAIMPIEETEASTEADLPTEVESTPKAEKTGCGSAVTSAAALVALILGTVVCTKKKQDL